MGHICQAGKRPMSRSGSAAPWAQVKEGGEAGGTPGLTVKNLMVSALQLRVLGSYGVGGAEPGRPGHWQWRFSS